MPDEKISASLKKDITDLAILAVLAGILYLTYLGGTSLWDTDETLYTRIAREMQITGDYLTTQWNFKPWFCHPPLYFWLVNLCAAALGWTEFAARLPSALFGILTVILTYLFASMMFNRKVGFYSGLIITVTLQIWIQSRMAILDMPFLFFILASIFFYLKGVYEDNNRWFVGFWVCAGFAVLVKGPVGFLLPLIYVFFDVAIAGRWKKLTQFFISWGPAFFLIIAVPWFWAMIQVYGPDFTRRVFGYFFFTRIIYPVMNQAGAWYYYVPFFLAGFLPWTIFLPVIFYVLAKNFRDNRASFFGAWILFTFLLFTFAQTKRPNYILFIYPAVCMSLGWTVHLALDKNKYLKLFKHSLFSFSILTALVIVSAMVAGSKIYPQRWPQYKSLALPVAAALVLSGIIIFILTFKRKKTAFYAIIGLSAVLYLSLLSYAPMLEDVRPELKLIKILNREKKNGVVLAMRENFGPSNSVLYYTDIPTKIYENNEKIIKLLNSGKKYHVVMYREEFDIYRDKIKVPVVILFKNRNLVLFKTEELPPTPPTTRE